MAEETPDKKELEARIKKLNAAIKKNPEDADLWLLRGYAKNLLERFDDAIKDFDEAIRLCLERNSYSNNKTNKVSKDQFDRFDDHIKNFTKHEEDFPGENFLHLLVIYGAFSHRGFAKNKLKRYEEAITDYNEAIRLNPENDAAWNNRGAAKRDLSRYEEAIEDFEKALKLAPDNATIINNLAATKAQQEARKTIQEQVGRIAETKELNDAIRHFKRIQKYLGVYIISGFILLFEILAVCTLFIPVSLWMAHDTLNDKLSALLSIEPFSLLPWTISIWIIVFPLIWGLRLMIKERDKAQVMELEYTHLAYVETRILFYFHDEKDPYAKKLIANYINTTIEHSPSDKLIAMTKGASPRPAVSPTISPSVDMANRTRPAGDP